MDKAVKRFARRILLIHLALLGAVLAVVYFATHAIEQGARDQAMRQAERRQEILAYQTARGIESFYKNILDDMDLLPRADDTPGEKSLLPSLLSRIPARTPLGPRGIGIGFLLSRQLEERVSHLFVVEKSDMTPYGFLKDNLQAAPRADRRGETGSRAVLPTTQPLAMRAESELVERNKDWLRSVDAPSISPFRVYESSGGGNLVALPLGVKRGAVVVAAVPVEKIKTRFLDALNKDAATGAFLVDESMTAMAASRENLVGADLSTAAGPHVLELIKDFRDNGFHGSRVAKEPFHISGRRFEPALVTAERIEVVPGKQWFLILASPLSDIDQAVSRLFDQILLWALFVTIAVTGILVSTAITMIRSRAKAERARHDVIMRELNRARQIQQAWLPKDAPACELLDVAAVNHPANHISGDFYNWFDLPNGRTAFVIGDVTGHGMSAAFLMATTQLLVRTTMQRISDPGRCLTEVNRQLCTQVFNGQFVTMQLLVIDPRAGWAELSTAGHPAPLVAAGESNHAFAPIATEPQFVLGIEPDIVYETERLRFDGGSTLLLYTDGAADVEAPDGARFGSTGLQGSIPVRRGDARGLVDAVLRAVNHFRRDRELGDDLTLVAIHLRPSPMVLPRTRAEPVAIG